MIALPASSTATQRAADGQHTAFTDEARPSMMRLLHGPWGTMERKVTLAAATNYSGDALVTSDGGRHWHDTAQHATALVTLGSRGALVIAGDTKNDSLGPLARTPDLGAHWTQLAVRNKPARAPCCITASGSRPPASARSRAPKVA